jgi:hypothetical protein
MALVSSAPGDRLTPGLRRPQEAKRPRRSRVPNYLPVSARRRNPIKDEPVFVSGLQAGCPGGQPPLRRSECATLGDRAPGLVSRLPFEVPRERPWRAAQKRLGDQPGATPTARFDFAIKMVPSSSRLMICRVALPLGIKLYATLFHGSSGRPPGVVSGAARAFRPPPLSR